MDEKLDEKFDLKMVIYAWQVDFLERKKSKMGVDHYPLPLGRRHELLMELVRQIREDWGKPKAFFTHQNRNTIVEENRPHESKFCTREQVRKAVDCIGRALNWAIEEVYKDERSNRKKIESEKVTNPTVNPVVSSEEPRRNRKGRKFDPSLFRGKEDSDPEPEVEIDPEMAELLGLNKK